MPIINLVYEAPREWKPWSNTLLYLPMTDDLLDHSWNSVSTSPESSVSITTLNGVKCGYFNNWQMPTWLATVTTVQKTVSFWMYTWAYSWSVFNSNPCWIFSWDGAGLQSNWTIMFVWMQWSWAANRWDVSASVWLNQWVHVCWTNKSIYINWQLINTSSSNAGIVNLWYNYVIWWAPSWNCGYTKYTGYLSEFIMEDKVWSAEDILNYYNSTKSVYEDKRENFQEVEYIQSSWTQWIDTGVIATQSTKSQIKVRPLWVTWDVIYWYCYNNDNADYRLFNYNSKIYWDMSSYRAEWSTFAAWNDYEFEIWNNYVKNVWASSNLVSSTTVSSYTSAGTIKLNRHDSWAISSNRWYYVKIREWATQVRNLVPCYRKSDSVIWMFDKVNNKFYTNSWTGTFTKWADVN